MLYPVLTASRMVSDLSGIWDFKLDDGKGFTEEWYRRPLEDATTMPVPASYNDLKEGISFRDHYGWVFYQLRRGHASREGLSERRDDLRASRRVPAL